MFRMTYMGVFRQPERGGFEAGGVPQNPRQDNTPLNPLSRGENPASILNSLPSLDGRDKREGEMQARLILL